MLASFLVACSMAFIAAADPPPKPDGPSLHLANGGLLPGDLAPSNDPGAIVWRSPAFVRPFEFAAAAVNAVHWPQPAEMPRPSGDYAFELAGGDVVYGALAELTDDSAVIDSPRLGRLKVARSSLRRIDRWRDSADLVYSGPNGLSGWEEINPKDSWREESGQPTSDAAGSALGGDVGLPARAIVEFEVSWKAAPDFVLTLGAGPDAGSRSRAFRFEVWDGQVVAHRETESEADVAPVQAAPAGPGRAHLRAYLDQDAGRMLVTSSGGKPLADLKVKDAKPKAQHGVRLAVVSGDVRLERLRISRWSGDAPREAEVDRSRIHLGDGSIAYGKVERYDPSAKQFVVRGDSGETRVEADEIASVFLSPPEDAPPRPARLSYADGTRISGAIGSVEEGAIALKVPGVEGVARAPVDGLRSLVLLKQGDPPAPPKEGRAGRLEMDGLRLPGRLVDGREEGGASCLAWRPDGSSTASPLRPGSSGKIIYKDPPKPPTPQELQARQMQQVRVIRRAPAAQNANVALRVFGALTAGQPAAGVAPATAGGRRALHLRTGDVIPCEVTSIDESGVSFTSTVSASTFVPNEKIKAVELAADAAPEVRLTKPKRERLLTLPRMQRESPPTHMIRSRNGDYLRGRVLAMDAKTLRAEVRLEEKPIPRDRVSRIIWLHPEEIGPPKPGGKPAEPAATTRVQALKSDGVRLTFAADAVAEGVVSGKSDVLGPCRVKLAEVDQLLVGPEIEKTAATVAYGPWRLTPAVEPKYVTDDGSEGESDPGTESPLVGKAAPDFTLDLLDGKSFRLADLKGKKVVILDFWATWCGPCLQAMPQVDAVAKEFKDKDVTLVAVNLEEQPKAIKAMLERHKLDLTVALDRDGVVAGRYGATAIPQTVIIDKEGKVARLFIGGGPKFGESLREALAGLMPGAEPGPVTK